jgi:hypothetical protein
MHTEERHEALSGQGQRNWHPLSTELEPVEQAQS